MSALNRRYNNLVIMTDFHCGIANAQVEMRFQNVFTYVAGLIPDSPALPEGVKFVKWASKNRPEDLPHITNINNVPFGNIDYASYSLYSCYRALGSSTRPNIFIHVVDPGVGKTNDRSILMTDQGNVFIGPNNGSLSLMAAYFAAREIDYRMYLIDREFIQSFEQHRMESPTYLLPDTFHGRDLLAVTAGMIAAGVDPSVMAQPTQSDVMPTVGNYAQNICEIPMGLGQELSFHAFQDNTYGNLKTNISMDPHTFNHLVDEGAVFEVRANKSGLFGSKKIKFPAKPVFADMASGSPLLYLGSTFSPTWDERFIELAVNMDNAAAKLGVAAPYAKYAHSFTMKRLK